jgi:hypothetical protein
VLHESLRLGLCELAAWSRRFLRPTLLLRHDLLRKTLGLLAEELGKYIHNFGLYDLLSRRLHVNLLLLVVLGVRRDLSCRILCTLRVLVLLKLLWQVLLLWSR